MQLSNEAPRVLRQAIGRDEPFSGRFDLPLGESELYLGRTSPVIEGLAGWTLDQALDPAARDGRPVAARCGVISTSAVSARTSLLVARFRYHLQVTGSEAETLLCEEIVPLACTGPADNPRWLSAEEVLPTAGSRKYWTRRGAAEWLLLLQVDSDDVAQWMWGDCGRLYYWIRESDLRGRRFDRIWAILQCC